MAQYLFETENPSQFLRVIESLKNLDADIIVKENVEINPFESGALIKIEIMASYEQVLKNLSETKNSKTPLDTIRPLQ